MRLEHFHPEIFVKWRSRYLWTANRSIILSSSSANVSFFSRIEYRYILCEKYRSYSYFFRLQINYRRYLHGKKNYRCKFDEGANNLCTFYIRKIVYAAHRIIPKRLDLNYSNFVMVKLICIFLHTIFTTSLIFGVCSTSDVCCVCWCVYKHTHTLAYLPLATGSRSNIWSNDLIFQVGTKSYKN